MDGITIRAVHRHEWRDVKALRLRALQDEAAPIAFVDTFEEASLRADEFWQSRAAAASVEAGAAADARQFVAVASGTWVGSATALVERPGSTDFEGNEIYRPGIAIVGVYLAETHRGHGILPALLDAAVDWARELGLDHARLQVPSRVSPST